MEPSRRWFMSSALLAPAFSPFLPTNSVALTVSRILEQRPAGKLEDMVAHAPLWNDPGQGKQVCIPFNIHNIEGPPHPPLVDPGE